MVFLVPVAVACCATFTYTKTTPRTTKTTAGKKIQRYFGPTYVFTVIFFYLLNPVEKWTFSGVPEASRTFPVGSGEEISGRIRIAGPGNSQILGKKKKQGNYQIEVGLHLAQGADPASRTFTYISVPLPQHSEGWMVQRKLQVLAR